MKIYASRIAELRKELNLSQKNLGELLGVSGACVNRWEKGLRTPGAEYIIVLCKTFNCSADYLLGLSDV